MANVDAAVLAERIQAACTNAMLDWGRAVNLAEKDPKNEALALVAKLAGQNALRLAMGIAEKLP